MSSHGGQPSPFTTSVVSPPPSQAGRQWRDRPGHNHERTRQTGSVSQGASDQIAIERNKANQDKQRRGQTAGHDGNSKQCCHIHSNTVVIMDVLILRAVKIQLFYFLMFSFWNEISKMDTIFTLGVLVFNYCTFRFLLTYSKIDCNGNCIWPSCYCCTII